MTFKRRFWKGVSNITNPSGQVRRWQREILSDIGISVKFYTSPVHYVARKVSKTLDDLHHISDVPVIQDSLDLILDNPAIVAAADLITSTSQELKDLEKIGADLGREIEISTNRAYWAAQQQLQPKDPVRGEYMVDRPNVSTPDLDFMGGVGAQGVSIM